MSKRLWPINEATPSPTFLMSIKRQLTSLHIEALGGATAITANYFTGDRCLLTVV